MLLIVATCALAFLACFSVEYGLNRARETRERHESDRMASPAWARLESEGIHTWPPPEVSREEAAQEYRDEGDEEMAQKVLERRE